MSNEFSWGLILGFVLSGLTSLIINHGSESICQSEHDVADCMWVLVPTPQE